MPQSKKPVAVEIKRRRKIKKPGSGNGWFSQALKRHESSGSCRSRPLEASSRDAKKRPWIVRPELRTTGIWKGDTDDPRSFYETRYDCDRLGLSPEDQQDDGGFRYLADCPRALGIAPMCWRTMPVRPRYRATSTRTRCVAFCGFRGASSDPHPGSQ